MSIEAISVVDTMKLALEALESCYSSETSMYRSFDKRKTDSSITALRQAIEQAQPSRSDIKQEPVIGTKTWFEDGKLITQNLYPSDIYDTSPPPVTESHKRQPLTDEQLTNIITTMCNTDDGTCDTRAMCRAIEAAHGITASETEDSAKGESMSEYTKGLTAEQLIEYIANDYVELSHEKVLVQRNDFMKICREWLQNNLSETCIKQKAYKYEADEGALSQDQLKQIKEGCNRCWVGLTKEDIDKAIEDNQRFGGFRTVGFAYDLEAILKEKNTRNGDCL